MATRREQLITIDPEILGGKPVFVGTRVPLAVLFDNLADGMTVDEIVDSYPTLTKDLVEKVLADPEQYRRAQNAHAANGICNLDGPELSKVIADVQNRIIAGEITPQQAIDMKIEEIQDRQRRPVTQRMIDDAKKIDLSTVRPATHEDFQRLLMQVKKRERKTSTVDWLKAHADRIKEIVSAHGAANPRLFGSVLHGNDNEDSDIDILIDTIPGQTTLMSISAIRVDLETLLQRRVDVQTPNSLSEEFREKVIAEARAL